MWFSIVLLVSLLSERLSEEIFGCGGFVKSEFGINYSRVEIKLYTKQGALKYQTDCAPNNGYYLIPLYDKGDYVLKIEPPSGWTFEPDSVPLHVDGSSDPCSRNQDINFTFKGFAVTGQILSHGGSIGPTGIKVILKKSTGELLGETTSGDSGTYSFTQVYPGNYIIEASHPSWILEQSSESVAVLQDNVITKNKVIVAGYDVRGSVFSEGEPIQGVHFLLFSKKEFPGKKSLTGCSESLVKGCTQPKDMFYICHVTSASDGSFVFPSLPPSNYKLIPFYKGEHIEFDVSPSEYDFTVTQESFVFPINFQVEGFSVSGRVSATPKGKGLVGADIYVNGNKYTTTEENGIYHLENMRADLYQLEVKMPNIFFDAVTMKVTPNTPHLPEIIASKFSICGHLHIDQYPSGFQEDDRSVSLRTSEASFVSNIPVVDGHFCTETAPGSYIMEPVVTEAEINSGLKFVPSQIAIEVNDHPLLDIQFFQFRADVHGQVKCIKKCKGLLLELNPLSYSGGLLKTTTAEDGTFQFSKCLPGHYELTIMKDDWCFHSKTVKFAVSDKNVLDLEITQTGYQAYLSLTHPTKFRVKYPSQQVHVIELQKGKNIICLPESGLYDFIPVGCHMYKKDSFKFDTNDPTQINLSPSKHRISGTVMTEVNITDIKIQVKRVASGFEENIVLKEPAEKAGNVFKYKFSLYVEPYSDLEIKATSSQLLFRPAVSHVKVADDCIEDIVSISGKKGLFIHGSVNPPLENVKMQIHDKNTGKLLTEVLTEKSGKYVVGPLDDDGTYVVKAEKEGYILTQQKALGEFLAYKLAEIVVEVTNENGAPLSGALLSLSGGTDYRKNSLTQKDGKLSFSGLSPGQYFLRPMLKEFSFEPAAKMIDVKEGTAVNIKVWGKRVAYSLYGVINSLTGEAEIGVAVEAVGVNSGTCSQYQEDAISEQGGSFRIRGLQPNCEYAVRLKQAVDVNQHIERATPEERIVKVTGGDINGIRLIVFRRFNQMDISGNVITKQEYLPSLKVRLYKEDSPDQVLHNIPLGQSSFFHLPALPIDNRNYILRLDTSLSSSSYFIESPSITFCANTSFYHFTFSFHPHPKTLDQEMTQGSVLALPLCIVILLLLYNYTHLIPLAVQVGQIFSLFNSGRFPLSNEGAPTETVNIRRKSKPRRIQ